MEKRYNRKQKHPGGPDMIAKPIRSAFFAAVAVFLAAVTAAPFAAFAASGKNAETGDFHLIGQLR